MKSSRDELTGLLRMDSFMEECRRHLASCEKEEHALIYMNVELFHEFNQKYGMEEGDRFLKETAQAIQKSFPDGETCRLHDDHFAVLTEKEHLEDRIETVHKQVHSLQKGMRMELKSGICIFEKNHDDMASLLDHARLACKSIRKKYDHDFAYFNEDMLRQEELKTYVVTHFEEALEKEWIKVYYQPEIRTLTGQDCASEALSRWIDPEHGMLSPGIFIPVLEDAHLIHLLDQYVITQVCRDMKEADELGLQVMPVSVNLSRIDFQVCDIFECVEKIRKESGIDRQMLKIEITESALNSDPEYLEQQIVRFRKAGYEVWMDDFGSGYSSLNTLKDFDFDLMKIDLAFLKDFNTNPRSSVIIASMVNMAKSLGIHTLAEGVETQQQADFLRSIGCERMQGFLYSCPIAKEKYRDRVVNKVQKEKTKREKYYNDIGRVDMLSSSPLNAKINTVPENSISLAILEKTGDRITTLYCNKAYQKYLQSIGLNVQEAENLTNNEDMHIHNFCVSLMEQCEKSAREQQRDTVINGRNCSIHMRWIASCDDANAFAVSSVNLSGKNYSQSERTIQAINHLISLYDRIDIFYEDGRAVNAYLDSEQHRLFDEKTDAGIALKKYCEHYIVSDERESFRQFYDFKSVNERASKAKKNHVTSMFHSIDEEGNISLQMYILIPFVLDGEKACLSCVRNVDAMNRQGMVILKDNLNKQLQ